MIKRTLLLAVSVAMLALPATAQAKEIDVKGPGNYVARGPVRAELSSTQGAEAIVLSRRAGLLRFVDLGGDMKVECQGKGKTRSKKNADDQTVVFCAGRAGRARVTGSKIRIVAAAMRLELAIPEGWSGTLKGRVREQAAEQQPEQPQEQPADE